MPDIEVHPDVIGLSGGLKQFWLRCNRGLVEAYYHQHGPDATLKYFNLRQETLQRFFDRRSQDVKLTRLSENDRWVYRAAMESIRDVKRRVARLEEFREEIEPVIQVGRGIIATLGQLQDGSRESLKKSPALQLTDLRRKSGK